jgi:hypothetical protein
MTQVFTRSRAAVLMAISFVADAILPMSHRDTEAVQSACCRRVSSAIIVDHARADL